MTVDDGGWRWLMVDGGGGTTIFILLGIFTLQSALDSHKHSHSSHHLGLTEMTRSLDFVKNHILKILKKLLR